ncbi:MAG: permease-like cell division protein FtsX [Bacteroidales bacterium]|jgi:cell division transport system permease protein|nr:permease-like cell division protein FtsX [Bacteroidales bacterium]NLK80806.1 cell division protein FtsX [Bacteroidales bacterium]
MKATKQHNYIIKRRLFSSYSTTLISISLVLFVLSLVGLLVFNQHKISNHVKENIGFTVFLKKNYKEADMHELRKRIDAMPFVKSSEYVSPEQASSRLAETLGQDYIDLANGHPVPPSIEVRFVAAYATSERFAEIEQLMEENIMVDSVHYDKVQIESLNTNIRKISIFLLGFSFLLFIISIVLIHNTIRLSIYSKRFVINTMQLVGATNNYIRAPFLLQGAFHGFYSAIIALSMLAGLLYFLQTELKEFSKYLDFELLGVLFLSVILLGMFLSLLATFFAVTKFLNIQKDNLYI